MSSSSIIILNGSPRKNGNTAILLRFVREALLKNQESCKIKQYDLYPLNFKGCCHCDACKKVINTHGCVLNDDFKPILDALLTAELIIIASPVYCWAVSGCLSSALDRFYSLLLKGPSGKSLLAGKKMLGAFTSGGIEQDGMDLCIAMLKQLCVCGNMEYQGTFAAPNCTTPEELLIRENLKQEIFEFFK